jgi:hypothetical protein
MTTMTVRSESAPRAALNFPVRSRFTTVRDLAMIALCAVICGGFVWQAWSGPTPDSLRSPAAQSAEMR